MVQKMSGSGTPTRIVKALEDRSKSIKRWMAGDTAKQKPERQDEQFTIKFDKGTVFLSAVASADIDEVIKLLDKGVDIDTTNNDGLTALHQACIDENDEMVELLLERGANIEAVDNEGWTPLHAAASAGNVDIARILVENDANLAAVNNEGEVPLDLADEDEMDEYLSDEIDNQELEVEEARNEEERVMIEDATSWLNQKKIDEVLDWQEAGALHVAAAKGYNKVISTILQIGDIEVNVRDADGWTPLHAAVHWGSQTATELLTEAGADFDLKNNNGQTACDLAEADFLKVAENCRKRSKELGKKSSSKRGENGTDVNDNSLYAKEINAIEMLKKQPKRPIVKGSRVIYQNKLNNPQAANEEEEKNGEDKEDESESEEETAPSPPPPTTKTTKTSTASISSINKANDVDTSINKTIIKSRSNEREEKKDTSTPIVVKTTVGVGISSRFPKRDPEPEPAATKPIGSRYGVGSTRSDRITSSFDKRSSSTSNTEENNTPSSTRVPFRTTPSRLRDEKDNDSDTNSSSITNRYRPKKTPDDNNSWRTPRKKEDEDTQETEPPRRTRNDDTSTTSTTSSIESRRARPSTDDDGGTRMSIAERLRKKNQELLATTNDNNNSSSSASSTGAGGRSWQRSNLTSNSTSSTSSDTGDTKDLQRKLDQAVKEVEEYKSKYEKLKKEKEELEKQLSQYKEDIDKVQELKSDNIRLKDENGALIRVISKLSRTPASSSS